MIHTGPSPGLPGFVCMESAVERAVAEAEVYLRAGVDGILVENMHDFPCVHEREMGPEVAAFMTRVAYAVKRRAGRTPVGLQVLFQANRTALAVALAAGCDFVRAEGWTYAHVADKGMAEACAGTVVRYRHHIRADHLPVFADVKKKHAAHALTADLSLADLARGMALHRADAVVVTGTRTGEPPSPDDLDAVCAATSLPVIVGSGVTAGNLGDLFQRADGFIVGSALKEGGVWDAPVCAERVEALVGALERCRAAHRSRLMEN
ncbi:BtpA/SgcQ family protein [Rhodocaloribacter litoris]|nr:BtpA/SgcQ family protein [Rhodocaloribacter litoris]